MSLKFSVLPEETISVMEVNRMFPALMCVCVQYVCVCVCVRT